jgi:hypothetical protein
MNELPVIPEIKANLTIDQRVELILDLTRRLELLDELLSNARARRCERDNELRPEKMFHAEDEMILEVGCGYSHQ